MARRQTPGPGPDAHRAFRLGLAAATVVAAVVIVALYWTGSVPPVILGFMVLLVFPVYLVCAASVLSVWLGYDKDPTDLQRVTREPERLWDR